MLLVAAAALLTVSLDDARHLAAQDPPGPFHYSFDTQPGSGR
jgi:hypothetical protein